MAIDDYHPYDLFLTGTLNETSVLTFQTEFRDAHTEVADSIPIRINISCDGGEISLSLAIVSQIHEYRRQGRDIITHGNGGTFSGGVTILQAGTHRTMDEFAMLMIHEPQVALSGWDGSLTELVAYNEAVKASSEKNISILAARTEHSPEFIRENFFNASDNYFDAGIALELNLVDEVIYAP
jgi:ATP-dependent protease ClpP protease subunit